MLLLIPLLPFVGFLVNAFLGKRLPKSVSGGLACLVMLGVVRGVGAVGVDADRRARHAVARGDLLPLDRLGRPPDPAAVPARSPVVADDPRHHRHRVADPHLFDGLHARGERQRIRALLLVPEPVRGVHARARARLDLPGDVRRLGRGRALLVPPDRLLVQEEVGRRRRQEGVHRQPHRRLRVHPRHADDLRDVRHARLPAGGRGGRRRAGRARRWASSRSPRCCCSSARPASRRRFRSSRLAARRDGRPDAGLGAHPRRDDGDGGRLHDRAERRALPARADHAGGGRRHRHRDGADGRHDRARAERHQARARVLDRLAARLHVPGDGRRRLRGRHLPSLHARVLQGAAVPRLRRGDPRAARRAGHPATWAA